MIGEVVAQRLGNTKLGKVFPALQSTEYKRLGIIPGADEQIDFTA